MNATFLDKAARIREERKKLGLTQAQAAKNCGMSRSMWIRYEQGQSAFDGAPLRAFGAIGADTAYILSGIKSSAQDLNNLQVMANIVKNQANGEHAYNEFAEATAAGSMVKQRNLPSINHITKTLEQFSEEDLNTVKRIVDGLWSQQVKEITEKKE